MHCFGSQVHSHGVQHMPHPLAVSLDRVGQTTWRAFDAALVRLQLRGSPCKETGGVWITWPPAPGAGASRTTIATLCTVVKDGPDIFFRLWTTLPEPVPSRFASAVWQAIPEATRYARFGSFLWTDGLVTYQLAIPITSGAVTEAFITPLLLQSQTLVAAMGAAIRRILAGTAPQAAVEAAFQTVALPPWYDTDPRQSIWAPRKSTRTH